MAFIIEDGVLRKYCTRDSVTDIVIPDNVTSIGNKAFDRCTTIESITIPDSVTEILRTRFMACVRLKIINVSENNKFFSSIDGVLFNKEKTTLIRYPEGKCDKNYIIPDSVTKIGNYAFDFCEKLESVIISDNVTRIGNGAFSGCESLESITIFNNTTKIGNIAFYCCTSLESITLPNHFASLQNKAFEDKPNLKHIIMHGKKSTFITNEAVCKSNGKFTADAEKMFLFIEADDDEKIYVFEAMRKSVYKIPMAVFLAEEYGNETAKTYLKRVNKKAVEYFTALGEQKIIDRLISAGILR